LDLAGSGSRSGAPLGQSRVKVVVCPLRGQNYPKTGFFCGKMLLSQFPVAYIVIVIGNGNVM